MGLKVSRDLTHSRSTTVTRLQVGMAVKFGKNCTVRSTIQVGESRQS